MGSRSLKGRGGRLFYCRRRSREAGEAFNQFFAAGLIKRRGRVRDSSCRLLQWEGAYDLMSLAWKAAAPIRKDDTQTALRMHRDSATLAHGVGCA
jgi:hypothetical protein